MNEENNEKYISNFLNLDMCLEMIKSNIDNYFIAGQICNSIDFYKLEKEKEINKYRSTLDKAYNYVLKCEYELIPANVGWVNDLKNILKGSDNNVKD